MRNLNVLLLALLLVACGTTKKSSKEIVKETNSLTSSLSLEDSVIAEIQKSTQTSLQQTSFLDVDDSTEIWTVTTTSWYDTEKADSNGVAPLMKQETVRSAVFHGKRSKGQSGNALLSETKSNLTLTSQEKVESGVSAEKVTKTSTQNKSSATNTRSIIYVAAGMVFTILMAILAYWVFTKYRAERLGS